MKAPEIIELNKTYVVGIRIRTTLAENKTFELWRAFKPRVGEIKGRLNNDFYSIQQFERGLQFEHVTPLTPFFKWAAVEVDPGEANIPAGMQPFSIPEGKYAVFIHNGLAGEFPKTLQYIFGQWLPSSSYSLDDRPQFEIMTKEYRPDDPEAMEEVWIPLKQKAL